MQYEGKITTMLEKQLVWANQLPKRSIVLEEITDKEWKWGLVIDFLKEKVDMLDEFKVWDQVRVSINTRASEYNGRWYNNITGWRIEALWWEQSASAAWWAPAAQEYEDELPF